MAFEASFYARTKRKRTHTHILTMIVYENLINVLRHTIFFISLLAQILTMLAITAIEEMMLMMMMAMVFIFYRRYLFYSLQLLLWLHVNAYIIGNK